ncbi:hypothetical protein DM02DRAFT_7663 [Periconia macrospinosa]|uniref:Uncharacterized protein n=1 Tax=Periconia macrospinosa TaxID=97972 RepID=A0A2V1EDE0_9PLEO|nr:hypothetical protein DM02DRAFT_7663 [Periconia macrospinosa]
MHIDRVQTYVSRHSFLRYLKLRQAGLTLIVGLAGSGAASGSLSQCAEYVYWLRRTVTTHRHKKCMAMGTMPWMGRQILRKRISWGFKNRPLAVS